VLDGAPADHVVPPDGCTSLVAGGSTREPPVLLASGPWLRPLVVPVAPGEFYCGLRIRVGAARQLLDADPAQFRNRAQPAGPWLGDAADALARRLGTTRTIDAVAAELDAAFLARLGTLPEPDAVVARAADRLVETGGELAIGALARELGISERTLLRRFRAATGLAPKQFARVRRLVTTVRRLLGDDSLWARLAAEGGYTDQSHLNRDLVELTGITPREFAARVRLTRHDGIVG
jgi:AraC-like DNA-binding protein